MTFTTEQMQHNRYTTRGATLDLLNDVCEESARLLASVPEVPADGLSLMEAHMLLEHAKRSAVSLERFAQAIQRTRSTF